MWTAFYEDTNEILFPLLIEIDVGKLFFAFDVFHRVPSLDCSNESLTSVLHKLISFQKHFCLMGGMKESLQKLLPINKALQRHNCGKNLWIT